MSLNGSDQDPWGKPTQNGQSSGNSSSDKNEGQSNWDRSSNSQKKNEQSPPDLEEVFNNLLNKMGGKGAKNNNSNHANLPSGLGKLLPIAIAAGVILWGASGFYTIKEAERGVVLRLGQFHSIEQPGLNWKPTFIDRVIPVNVERVQELKTQGSMLTQDENMVKVEMTVQYRVQNPEKYLFSAVNANDSLNQATDSALRYVIGHMTMNDILTTGRSVVRENTWKALNQIIEPYDMGLEVIDVNFQSARPPEEVKDAFDDAIKAQEDEQRYIREAEAYAREKEPIARGNAQRILEEATAYKDRVVLDAKGEVERFQPLLPEFKAAPDVFRERLYIQSMEKVMANTPKVMLDAANGNNLTVLPLEQLLKGKKTYSANANGEEIQQSVVNSAPVSRSENRANTPNRPSEIGNESSRQGRFN
ncbi:Modulator of FtsH protease HflK [Aggregatibacter actinomycetemcomitans]|uniref:FtsH protease activity modulator HflK n=1 Tax=Aggregatibacter actinomycetemcomitans TaxID=714 RepID=UPI0001B9F5C0|nr:FtsH protease activity modulator HflK [Aggregatibacter actinomycetemcomitans]ACX82878.1 membrane protease HflK [Aggregatibacter actinomycetemcomitans D11S-1]KOE59309.1 membrane protease HflK [Aggregatibacter actinomycetemcomitans serotype c str. SCC2302]KOE61667.1 membrane protease HflK [Aggregatibacter actinomycetemcomitans serotype c str. AAS4A]KOE61831.1 membrane protease HflK [Aggregatibacter actinomycetemcomitans serotype c str. D17P-2]MCE3057621.1 FtsH protease activity modulator HflK